jgi:hypothetical protein
MHSLNFRILLITCIFILLSSGNKAISQTPSVRINEFMAVNSGTVADEDGDYSDWIEIYNPTPYNVDLTNWSLTDDKRQIRKWVFPSVTLKKGCYLIVFASGKNRKMPGDELHTNFNLSGTGEYLALYSSSDSKITEFSPFFNAMKADISYGFWNGEYRDLTVPTPGRDNDPSTGTQPSVPVFSKKHGFYDAPFTLEISAADPGVKIYYTTGGKAPDAVKGTLYSTPLTISGTSVIRAEMLADPKFTSTVKEALLDLPVVSLVTDRNYLFSKTISADTGGIYIYTGTAQGRGYNWERPVSLEYFDDNESVSLQVNCGMEMQGNEGRRPEKSPKNLLRLKILKNLPAIMKMNGKCRILIM